jgi:Mrp family chromosome partitioning ATPase
MMMKDQAKREPLPLGKPKKAFDVLGFAKRYGLFILLLGGFIFTMLTPLIFVIKKPYYEVHALMRVDPIVPTLLSSAEESSIVNYYDRYANTAARSMTTVDILSKTLDAMEHKKREALFPKAMPSETGAAILQNLVTVEPINRTHVLDLKISGSKPEGLAEFLNTLMQTYMDETRKTNNSSNSDRLRFLYAQKNVISQEMSGMERDLDSLTKDISTSSFSEVFNVAAKNRDNLSAAYNSAMNDRVSAETSYLAIKRSNAELKKIALDPLINEIVLNNNALTNTESWTYQQLQQLRSTTDGLTEVNPERIYVEDRMKSMKAYAKELREEVRSNARKIIIGKRDIDMDKSQIVAKNNYEASKAKEDTLRLALNINSNEAKRISMGIHRGEYLTAKWQNKVDLLNNIEKRITEIEIEKKAPSRLFVLSVARKPDQPLKSNINQITMLLLIGSFGLIAGVFAIYEYFDDTIRNSKDIVQALGHPPVQTIVNLRKQNTEDQEQFSLAPDNFRAHQIGSLAVKFYREKENAGVILFTGTDKGVGASSITVSCANALSQLVPKVLIIDGEIEAAPIEEADEFQINLPGLCDYLAGKTTVEESIISTPGDNIDMMYAGNITGNNIPRQKIHELIVELKKEYDFICIDGAPLLKSHLVEQFAMHADIVALIALGDSSKFKDLRKSAELLVLLGVPVIAPILNFGGLIKTLSLVEMFDNPPEILKKLLPEKAIDAIKRTPSGLQMVDRILKAAQKFQQPKG